ncbi:MAG: hypothetical protein JXB30_08645 [Anaerolineae bacterium]|nr:hypothetical protein [Anaerolineae bacterium]
MAVMIQAVSAYGPRVERTHTVQTREVAEYVAARTSLNRGEIENVLRELNEAIAFFAKQGSAVKLGGVGIFSPSINLKGILDVGFRLDSSIDAALNIPGAFTGSIIRRENVGKSVEELKAMWNEEHPDDPIP